jgi:hypothetical protein
MNLDENGNPTGAVGGVDLRMLAWHEIELYAFLDYSPPGGRIEPVLAELPKEPIAYRPLAVKGDAAAP